MLRDIEFAIRELAVSLDHVLKAIEDDPFGYEKIPSSLHHALMDVMREIQRTDWEEMTR